MRVERPPRKIEAHGSDVTMTSPLRDTHLMPWTWGQAVEGRMTKAQASIQPPTTYTVNASIGRRVAASHLIIRCRWNGEQVAKVSKIWRCHLSIGWSSPRPQSVRLSSWPFITRHFIMYDDINFQTYRIAGRFFNQYPPALLTMWAFVATATYISIGA